MKKNDPWKMGNKWGEPYYCPILLPGESFQALEQVEGVQVLTTDLLNWGDEAAGQEKPRRQSTE